MALTINSDYFSILLSPTVFTIGAQRVLCKVHSDSVYIMWDNYGLQRVKIRFRVRFKISFYVVSYIVKLIKMFPI
jgi:hypothetical protein